MNFLFYPILFIVGSVFGYFLRKLFLVKYKEGLENKLEKKIEETKIKQKELLLQAQDESLKIINQAKNEEKEGQIRIRKIENHLNLKEERLDHRFNLLIDRENVLKQRIFRLRKIKNEIEKNNKRSILMLQKISSLTKEEARSLLLKKVEEERKGEIMKRIRKLEQSSADEMESKAKKIITLAIERYSSSCTQEITTTSLSLPNEEMKGRIIGKEGRNIHTIERLTGVDILIDESPDIVILSSFAPIRRFVAKKALEKLMLDGRIQPARIEAAVEQAKKEIAQEAQEAGEKTLYELGLSGFDPRLVRILGRLKYRMSFGQNVLKHSIDVANLAALLAGELQTNIIIAKQAGLFHDLGKALDHEIEGTHPEIGANILKKFNIDTRIIQAVEDHHKDKILEETSLESAIVGAADSISGSRLGSRKDSYEDYLKRLKDLEDLAKSFKEVEKAYAVQAGREIRVFLNADKADDLRAIQISEELTKKIEEELKYPGKIKVNLIREKRVINFAY